MSYFFALCMHAREHMHINKHVCVCSSVCVYFLWAMEKYSPPLWKKSRNKHTHKKKLNAYFYILNS